MVMVAVVDPPAAPRRGVPALRAPAGLAHLVCSCGCIAFELTPREAPVLELVAEGRTTREAARRLYVSEQAVTYHIANLLAKFQAANRTELVARAFVLGLLEPAWPPRVRGAGDDAGTTRARIPPSVKDCHGTRTHR
jgi:DNA-binding CsgD family transcriptional regulator